MNFSRLIGAALLPMFIFSPLSATAATNDVVVLDAVQDTYITELDGYGGKNTVQGDNMLRVLQGITGLHRTHSLIQFDLSAFEGEAIGGDTVEFTVYIRSGWGGNQVTQSISVRECLVAWDEDSATWANFGGTGFNAAAQTGPNLTTRNVTYHGITEPVVFSIPSEVVQRWIDQPESNHGLILISNTSALSRDMSFWSKETGSAPSLSFAFAENPEINLYADVLTNMLVAAGESITQTLTISNAGIGDLEFSFCDTGPAVIEVSQDTYITEHDGYGGKNKVQGDNVLRILKGITGLHRTHSLIQFDLSAFEGEAIGGDTVEFTVYIRSGWGGNQVTQSISVRECLVAWDEDSATWADFGGTGFNETAHTGPNLATRDVTYHGITEPVVFSIPSEVVQRWLDQPESNHGLILISNTSALSRDMSFWSKETGPAPSLSVVLDGGPAAYYPFNGNANDESGNGYDGTVIGATLTEDRFGTPDGAYHFDGVNDYIDIGIFDEGVKTVSMWIRQGPRSEYDFYFGHNTFRLYASILSNGGLMYGDGSSSKTYADVSMDDYVGEWVHVAVVGDGSDSKIYLNGVNVTQSSGAVGPALSSAVNLGRWPGPTPAATHYMNGDIDDVRIYTRALSADEVAYLYAETPGNKCTLTEWLAVEPMSGTVAPGGSMDIALTYSATSMVAGDYAEHMVQLYSNDPEYPVMEAPVSMWVIPSAPEIDTEPLCTPGRENLISWTVQEGPVEYRVEAMAVQHYAPTARTDNEPLPPGWDQQNRFARNLDCWSKDSGWIQSANYWFDELRLNTIYMYRVKASVVTEIGRLDGDWSEWVPSCQVPVLP